MIEVSHHLVDLLIDVSWKFVAFGCISSLLLWAGRIRDAALLHLAWRTVMLGMLTLPAVCWWAPELPVSSPATLATLPAKLVSLGLKPEQTDFRIANDIPLPELASKDEVGDQPASAVTPAKRQGGWTWQLIIVAVYLLGVAVMIARLLGAWWLTRRLVGAAERLTGDLWEASGDAILGRDRSIAFSVHPAVQVPMATGWLEPAVLLPLSWHAWDETTRRWVLDHELIHIKRGDYAALLLAAVNRCIFWFHPLAWMVHQKLASLAERACDQAVIAFRGDRSSYAKALLTVATSVTEPARYRTAWVGASMLDGERLSDRIEAVLAAHGNLKVPRRLAASTLVVTIATGAATAGTVQPTSRPEALVEEISTRVMIGSQATLLPLPVTKPARIVISQPISEPRPAPRSAVLPTRVSVPSQTREPADDIPPVPFSAADSVQQPNEASRFVAPTLPVSTQFRFTSTPAPIEPVTADPRAQPAEDRCSEPHMYILWFDDQNRAVSRKSMVSGPPKRWLEDVASWLREDLCPSDLVAIVSYKNRLRIHQDFSIDREASVKALAGVTRRKYSQPTEFPRSSGPSLVRNLPPREELDQQSRKLPQSLDLLARASAQIEGRKHLILLAKGLSSWNVRGSRFSVSDNVRKQQADRLRNSGVVVHLLRTGRPAGGAGSESLLVDWTGGFAYTARRDRPYPIPGHSVLSGLRALARAIELST